MTKLAYERAYSEPSINRNHIDGPLLIYSDGQLHWLTIVERIALFFGRTDAANIQAKRRPELARKEVA